MCADGKSVVSYGAAALFLCAAFVFAPAFAAQQTTAPQTAAKSTTPKSASAKPRSAKKRKPRESVQMAPRPDRISEIQSALAAQGAYKGEPNGKWDDATAQAMKNFQSAHGLSPTGKLDALSLQKLGLGSEIAGRAAPLPLPQAQTAPGSAEQRQTP
jgi:peptidoglycan hydrolase-like protein with peptidoglycan-binding domain